MIFLASLAPLASVALPLLGVSAAAGIKTMMLAYLPGFPNLFFYMLAQRKKVLGGGTTTKSGKKDA